MVHWCVMLLTGTNYYSASVLLQDMSPGSMQTYVAVVERSTLLNEACTETHRRGRRLMPHCCCFPAVGQTLTQQSDTVTHQGALSWSVSGLIRADHSRHRCLQGVHYNQSVFVLICDKAKLSSISCRSRMMPFAALEYLCEALS